MSRIAIIGAGIAGLTLGKILSQHHHTIRIFESDSRPGGLVKCSRIEGSLFHTCGGHVFNTKNQQVLDFFWSIFDRDKEFVKSDRNSVVVMPDSSVIPYPIENHAYLFEDETLKRIIQDITDLKTQILSPGNFKEFLEQRFGKTLYELYFRPYNEKIWRSDLSLIPLSWLEGKLPMPTPEEILFNNIRKVDERAFVHSTFWYERFNGSQHIIDKLSDGLEICCKTSIDHISYEGKQWNVAGDKFDKVIFCGDLRQLPKMAPEINLNGFTSDIESLQAHGTTTVFCEIERNPYSWVYLPDSRFDAHRIICTGNFSESNNAPGKMTATVEFTDDISKEEILRQLPMLPFKPHYITHKFNPLTYPIQSAGTRAMIEELKKTLTPHNLYLCGRFAEWEYFNMDKAMESAMKLAASLNK